MLLSTMVVEGLYNMKVLYEDDADFFEIWKSYKEAWSVDITPYFIFFIQERLLLKNHQLCIPRGTDKTIILFE